MPASPHRRNCCREEAPAPFFSAPLALLFLVNALNFYDRQALGAVIEPLRREFHLSDTRLGALTTAFTLIYAFAGVPLGRLADVWSRRKLLAIGTAVWAGLTGLGGLATSYAALLATRLGVGIGEAACAPAATSWIGDIVPPGRRARAMAAFMMAVPVGGMLSFAITGPAAQAWGWRVALALAAAPAVALVPALLWLKEPARSVGDREALGPAAGLTDESACPTLPSKDFHPFGAGASACQARFHTSGGTAPPNPGSLRLLMRLPSFWWIVASGAVVNFALYSFSTFLPAFLTRFHGLSVARAGLWTGIGSGVAGILGAVAAGVFGDRGAGNRGQRRLRLAAGAALMAAPLAFAAIRQPAGRAALAIPLIMAAYGLLQTYYGLVYAALQDVVAPGLRGAAMGAYFMAMYLCGASFGPVATGRLSDVLAKAAAGSGAVTEAARAIGLREAMYLIPALSVALAGVLWAGGRAMKSVSR
jgi:MFS family permease